MNFSLILVLSNLLATFYMIGLIWMVQIVHYPLFAKVGPEQFVGYQTSHQSLTSLVVGPPMLIELLSAVGLIWYRPAGITDWPVVTSLALLVIIWLSTMLIQVPCHEQLTRGFDASVHRWLVVSNWIRTAGWSLRGVLAVWMLASLIRHLSDV